ncbi:MAG: site-specific DNA-methyltransferase [Kangiellaceae bacterium]|nr:site-specific DNA-methyltransferase [Kangiellaceae bacterium]
MSKFNELVTKLREVFQIDRPELDFGVYRILNARADEINEYLEKRLKQKVEQALASGNAANIDQLKDDLKKAEQAATDAGFDPAESPKVKELQAKIAQASSGNAEHENAVFSHLLTFFSRYYDNGDFISQRRYKGDTYAIPYAGEEVMLHWANKDQYYIKSGENFSNYSFKLEDGRVVHFRLVSADTAKDNRKDNDKERRFVLAEQKVITRIDDEGDEYDDEILPIEEITNKDANGNETKELIIRFEYKAMPKGSKQDSLVSSAVKAVLAASSVASRWLNLSKREPTEKNPKRTLLEKHLTNYTTKNTADYFIHKNLGKFLRGELDFYIKNEVMHLDDVQNAEAFSDIEKNLRMIQCLRSIALDLIKFLAQLEDFQKRLWTKKKFVVSSHYCITLDHIFSMTDQVNNAIQQEKVREIQDYLISEILNNNEQWKAWRNLGIYDDQPERTVEYIRDNKYLSVDTSLYSERFNNILLKCLDEIDNSTNGIIVNSDNYQGLRFLENRYCSNIDSIYIDPPYNSAASEILYKNEYKHSSWLSLMASRYQVSLNLLSEQGIISTAIDDVEFHRLEGLNNQVFGEVNHLGNLAIMHNPKGRDQKYIASSHEYTMMFAKNKSNAKTNRLKLSDSKVTDKYPKVDAGGSSYRELPLRRRGSSPAREDRPFMYFPFLYNESNGDISVIPFEEYELIYRNRKFDDEYVDQLKTKYEALGLMFILPVRDDDSLGRWRWGYQRCAEHISKEVFFVRGKDKPTIYVKDFADSSYLAKSLWFDNRYDASTKGTNLLKDIIPNNVFDYPKSIFAVEDIVYMTSGTESLILDFFGGSGTTAHAVINLNRKYSSNRKYMIVEMGEHCDTVIKPRVQKIAFSSDWKKGRPATKNSGQSNIVKIIKLESYEDALNNLELKKPKVDLFDNNPELKDDYLLNYMLDVESRGSLLSTDDFKKPFDYTMKIAVDSAGAFEEQKVDLVETFNYLIGLTVKHIDAQPERGFVTVTGTLPSNETCLVLWRDCEKNDYEGLNKLCDKLALNPADNEFDVVYINGDHNIPTVLTQTAEEGGETRVLKLRQIEPEFLERMFAEEDA